MSKPSSFFSSIDWKNHFVELITVIIGISIAFSLNNWNESRKDRNQEKKYIRALLTDLEKDQERLQELLDTSQYYLSRTERLIRLVNKKDFMSDSIGYYLGSTYTFASFKPNDNTFEGLRSSGRIGLIEDFALRQKIIHHYNQHYGECQNFDDFFKNFLEGQLMPLILKNVDFRMFPLIGNSEFIRDTYFINLMYSSQYYQSTRIQIYQGAYEHSESLMEDLKSYL